MNVCLIFSAFYLAVRLARREVHLITSIPPEVYRRVDPLPEGAVPSGGWLHFREVPEGFREGDAIEAIGVIRLESPMADGVMDVNWIEG